MKTSQTQSNQEMSSIDFNNYSVKFAKLRAKYFGTTVPNVLLTQSGNKNLALLNKLLTIPKNQRIFDALLKKTSTELYDSIILFEQKKASGKIDAKTADECICLLFGAIVDACDLFSEVSNIIVR